MILFWNQWCLLKAAFFWKTILVVIYAKIVHPSFISTIYDNFKSVSFYLSGPNENLETCIPVWYEQLKELKQFWGILTGQYFNKSTLSQKCKISCSLKTTCSHIIFTWLSPAVKQLLEKFHFEFLHAFNFPNKLALVGKILWRFDILLHISGKFYIWER